MNIVATQLVYTQKLKLIKSFIDKDALSKKFPFIKYIPKNLQADEHDSVKIFIEHRYIPFYNLGEYLEETIISLQKIHFKNVEILIIDDGSTEKASIDKLTEIEKRYSVKVYPKNKIKGSQKQGITVLKSVKGNTWLF